MVISKKGIDLIKEFEGFRADAYKDPGNPSGLPITIGYGSTMYQNGNKIKLGDKVTPQQAEELLAWEIKNKTDVINGYKLELNQNQFDALCSFVYNLGIGALGKSTLLKKVKVNPNDKTIEQEFLKWNKAGGKAMAGLTRRRQAEARLYFS